MTWLKKIAQKIQVLVWDDEKKECGGYESQSALILLCLASHVNSQNAGKVKTI